MTTRNRLSEQCELLFLQSYENKNDIKPRVDRRATAILVDQVASALLGLKLQQEIKVGVIDIPHCAIAIYTGIATTQTSPFTAALPAFPLALPQDVGVWAIRSSDGIYYIPLKSDFWSLMSDLDEGALEDQIGFFVRGRTITFTKQPTATVDIELLITDPSLLGPFDPYPVSQDMEVKIIEGVVNIMKASPMSPEKPKN